METLVQPLTPADLDSRFAEAISSSMHLRVVLEDVLGEGEGAWDDDPRYPGDAVNCMTWLQFVISEVYGRGSADKTAVMDRVRYYGGHVGYGLRKHFVDHWMALEPEPLRRIDLSGVEGYQQRFVELDLERFKTFHQYPCELYRQDVTRIKVEYLTADGLGRFVQKLNPGYYVAFGVAKAEYLRRYGGGCGPMGLVHSLVLQVTAAPAGMTDAQGAAIYHASTRLGAVTRVELPAYLPPMEEVFDGFALFELDPAWEWRPAPAEDDYVRRIKACEARLPRSQNQRRL